MNKEFDIIASLILGKCYSNVPLPVNIDFMFLAAEKLGDINKHEQVGHVFDWLVREGFFALPGY